LNDREAVVTEPHPSGSAAPHSSRSDDWDGLFARVGSELRTLAETVNMLQAFLMPLVEDAARRDPVVMTRLQDLDLVEQSLHGLSDLMSCLDASTVLTDAGALASGVKTIRLAGMAQRLRLRSQPSFPPPGEASGFELF
jgi:hypothetical protein